VKRPLAALLVAAFFSAGLAGLPAPAHADERSARAHFDEAESLYAEGDFEAALAEYQAAFAAAPLPAIMFDIAQCQRNLDHHSEAIFAFRRYLALDPDAPNREAVLKLVSELEHKRDRQAALRPPAAPPPAAPGSAIESSRIELVPTPPRLDGAHRASAARKPFYTKWWFITGVVVASAAVTGVILYDAQSGSAGATPGPGGPDVPASDFGNVELPR
jgi:tetratricopeptide (TPR) repeat protein